MYKTIAYLAWYYLKAELSQKTSLIEQWLKFDYYDFRKLEDGSYEVEGVVSIPRGHLSTAIMFRYYVVRGDTQWEEFIYNQQNNMRTLYLNPNDIKVYDGK